MDQNQLKQLVAQAAVKFVPDDCIVGVGTGSTVNFFIDELAKIKGRLKGAVSSSEASTQRLKQLGIPVFDLNTVGPDEVPVYVDGADEVNHHLHMIKGGGAALTREKIVAAVPHGMAQGGDHRQRQHHPGRTRLADRRAGAAGRENQPDRRRGDQRPVCPPPCRRAAAGYAGRRERAALSGYRAQPACTPRPSGGVFHAACHTLRTGGARRRRRRSRCNKSVI